MFVLKQMKVKKFSTEFLPGWSMGISFARETMEGLERKVSNDVFWFIL